MSGKGSREPLIFPEPITISLREMAGFFTSSCKTALAFITVETDKTASHHRTKAGLMK
jgi:hypothetical protein